MNEKINNKSNFRCTYCNKYYASQSSLCNHIKKFHFTNISKSIPDVSKSIPDPDINRKIICKFCNKKYSTPQNRWKHEQKCKSRSNNDKDKDKIKQLEETINELKHQIVTIMKEKGKVHHKTLNKINNTLTNSINNTNNGKITNISNVIVKFGDLEYERILNSKQIKTILNKQYLCLEEAIKQIHFNDNLPEYSNIFITNMKDDIGYVFNGNQFISVKKNEMLNELIDCHLKEINLSLEQYKDKINNVYVRRIEKFLDMLNDDDTKFTDENNSRTYPSYKAYKINSLKMLIYNESDKKKLDTLNSMELEEKVYEICEESNNKNSKNNMII